MLESQQAAPRYYEAHASPAWVPVTGVGIVIAASGDFSGWKAYRESVFGFGGWMVKLACLADFIGLQWRGASEVVGMTVAGEFFAVVVLQVFVVAMDFCFDSRNFYSIASGRPTLFPSNLQGAFACILYSHALFMSHGVEQEASASGDMTSAGEALDHHLHRPYFVRLWRTAASIGLLLSAVILAGCVESQPAMLGYLGLGYAVLFLYSILLRNRHADMLNSKGLLCERY